MNKHEDAVHILSEPSSYVAKTLHAILGGYDAFVIKEAFVLCQRCVVNYSILQENEPFMYIVGL